MALKLVIVTFSFTLSTRLGALSLSLNPRLSPRDALAAGAGKSVDRWNARGTRAGELFRFWECVAARDSSRVRARAAIFSFSWELVVVGVMWSSMDFRHQHTT